MLALSAAAFVLSLSSALAAPAAELETRATPVALTTAQIATYSPYTYFAAAGYCAPAVTKTWKCGREFPSQIFATFTHEMFSANCNATAGFVPTASGGNGADVQYCKYSFLNTTFLH